MFGHRVHPIAEDAYVAGRVEEVCRGRGPRGRLDQGILLFAALFAVAVGVVFVLSVTGVI